MNLLGKHAPRPIKYQIIFILVGNPRLWLPDRKIINHSRDNISYYEDVTGQYIDLSHIQSLFNINIETLMLGGAGSQFAIDKSIHNTFNFYQCSIGLQSNLNELTQLLNEKGN